MKCFIAGRKTEGSRFTKKMTPNGTTIEETLMQELGETSLRGTHATWPLTVI